MPQCLARIHLFNKIGVSIIIGRAEHSAALVPQQFPHFPVTPPPVPALVTSIPNVSAQSHQSSSANADPPLPAAVAHSIPPPARVWTSAPANDNPFVCTQNVATHKTAPQSPAILRVLPNARIRAIAAVPPLVPRVNYQFF